MKRSSTFKNTFKIILLSIISLSFLMPILIVLMNSFKGRFNITDQPFEFPTEKTFVGIANYTRGIEKTDFNHAFLYSLFITVCSVIVIVIFTSMTAWCITRVKCKISSAFYFLLAFSMIVPFQMVMLTMSKFANMLHLNNIFGIIVIYLGFGCGQAVFMFAGFVKSLPLEVEEASVIDGCNPIQTFFRVVFPMLKPITITIAILNTMWIWNDYLLPLLVIGSKFRTIPIAVQYLRTGYGSKDMGAMMAVLVLAVIPIVIFYLSCQKHIIKGATAGAVKG